MCGGSRNRHGRRYRCLRWRLDAQDRSGGDDQFRLVDDRRRDAGAPVQAGGHQWHAGRTTDQVYPGDAFDRDRGGSYDALGESYRSVEKRFRQRLQFFAGDLGVDVQYRHEQVDPVVP